MGSKKKKLRARSKRDWMSWAETKRELKVAIRRNGGKWPTQRVLREMGKGLLIKSIKHHGGVAIVREKSGHNEQMRIKSAKELEDIVRKL